MPELPALDAAGRASADRVQPAEAADTSPVMHDVVDSRARLCFSALSLGLAAFVIGLIRATFSMKVNTDVSATLEKETPPANSGLPGIELLKAAADTIKVVIEGLPKR